MIIQLKNGSCSLSEKFLFLNFGDLICSIRIGEFLIHSANGVIWYLFADHVHLELTFEQARAISSFYDLDIIEGD